MRKLTAVVTLLVLACASFAQGPAAPSKYHRGYKQPDEATLKKRHAEAYRRHGSRIQSLPKATPATFDCVQMGWMIPIQDQAQCGSCWDVSACVMLSSLFVKVGSAKNDGSFVLSPQYVLDGCGGQTGGCNGDDAPTVLDMCLNKGLPLTSDYGPYVAAPQRCAYTNQKLYQISTWGFCTPSQQSGIASTQDIKNSMVAYGPISSAVAANSDWDSYSNGVMPYRKLTPSAVDHDIVIVGWDDTKVVPGTTKFGAWKVQNQWGTSWGMQGFCWIGYGSHQLGTEAAWGAVAVLPPPPPTPNPPTPTPTPGTLTLPATITINPDGTWTPAMSPPSGGIVIPADKFKALQDEVQKLTDMLNQQQKQSVAPPCIEGIKRDIAELKEQMQKLLDATAKPTPKEEQTRLIIRTEWADQHVTLDGKDYFIGGKKEIAVAPGEHTAVAEYGSGAKLARKVSVAKGQTAEIDFPADPKAPSTAAKSDVVPATTVTMKANPSTATIVVLLPKAAADAPVTIDGRPTTQTGAKRTYVTIVPDAATYEYAMSVRLDGQSVRRTVSVRRGQVTTVDFTTVP